jgi:hypothetical protein
MLAKAGPGDVVLVIANAVAGRKAGPYSPNSRIAVMSAQMKFFSIVAAVVIVAAIQAPIFLQASQIFA